MLTSFGLVRRMRGRPARKSEVPRAQKGANLPSREGRPSTTKIGEFAVIRHRAPLTPEIEIARFQSEARQTEPNQTERPPSLGIRRSSRPIRRPSADPVLPQPMSFTSSDVAVFLSARRDEASANDTPGSQIEELRPQNSDYPRSQQQPYPSMCRPVARFESNKWFFLRSATGTPESCPHAAPRAAGGVEWWMEAAGGAA
ncbi:hypothetical protein THAOC_30107 [Thalassiosira oceanica]|uniref:Uncharacterized protein n=1 Tax=Thalassiosira oceanica TaxID=159749 RepID=K0REW3_THAOC|nr:hypothetical protein THAOC_30107 [Thalassiosira oceanica]|eukprot:EJK50794.1 hypothetical protein THAOC_30107 [Thalassiosira oceanica]